MRKRRFWFFLHIYLWISILPLVAQNTDNADKGEYMDEEIEISMPVQETETTTLPADEQSKNQPATSQKRVQQKVVNVKPGTYKVQVQSSLILRKAASRSGAQIGNLPNGTIVQVESCSNGWAYISCNSGKGYVSAAYLIPHTLVQTPKAAPKVEFTLSILLEKLFIHILLLSCGIAIFCFIKKGMFQLAYAFAIALGLVQLGMLMFVPELFNKIHPQTVGWMGTIIGYTCWFIASAACFVAYCAWWDEEEFEDFPPKGYILIAALSAIFISFTKLSALLGLLAAAIASVIYHRYRSEGSFIGIALHITACLACALTVTTLIAYFIAETN